MVHMVSKAVLPSPSNVLARLKPAATMASCVALRGPRPAGFPLLFTDSWQLIEPAVAYLHEHGTDSGCGDNNWPKGFVYLAGWGFGHATLNGKPLYDNYEMHFMVTQGMRDRKTLKVNYPLAGKKLPAGEVNPATQQIDFYIRSPKMDPRNKPAREVFMHFFGMEITWK